MKKIIVLVLFYSNFVVAQNSREIIGKWKEIKREFFIDGRGETKSAFSIYEFNNVSFKNYTVKGLEYPAIEYYLNNDILTIGLDIYKVIKITNDSLVFRTYRKPEVKYYFEYTFIRIQDIEKEQDIQIIKSYLGRVKIDSMLVNSGRLSNDDANIYTWVNIFPKTKGNEDFKFYLKKKMKDLFNESNGDSYLTLVVEKDGSLSNIEFLQSINSSLERKLLKEFTEMPKLIPGMIKDKKVRTRITIKI